MEDDLDFENYCQTLSAVPQLTGTVSHSSDESTDEESADRSADYSLSADPSLTPPTAYSDVESNFDCEESAFNVSVKEEEKKYENWYKALSEWVGEDPKDGGMQN